MHAWKFPSMHGKTNCFHGDGTICECDEMCVHRRSTLLTHKQSHVDFVAAEPLILRLTEKLPRCSKSRDRIKKMFSRARSRDDVSMCIRRYISAFSSGDFLDFVLSPLSCVGRSRNLQVSFIIIIVRCFFVLVQKTRQWRRRMRVLRKTDRMERTFLS